MRNLEGLTCKTLKDIQELPVHIKVQETLGLAERTLHGPQNEKVVGWTCMELSRTLDLQYHVRIGEARREFHRELEPKMTPISWVRM